MSALWTAGGTAPHEIDDANEKVKSWQEGERRGINYKTSVYIHWIYKWMNEWMMGSVMGFATSMGKEDFLSRKTKCQWVIPWNRCLFIFGGYFFK